MIAFNQQITSGSAQLPAQLPCRLDAPKKSKEPKKPKAAWELARPHKYMFCDEADSLVALLRLNPDQAKLCCPDLPTIDGNTGADDIMLSIPIWTQTR